MNATTSRWMRAAVAAVCAAGFGACGGGGGGGDDGGNGDVTPNTAPVAVAVALGGPATRGQVVSLDGSGSSDEDGDELTYLWTQVGGPDVTGGAGTLVDVAPSFIAPSAVVTLQFDLTVNDGTDTSSPHRVTVNVLEDAGAAIFVDGDAADGGNGSQAAPYRTIKQALLVASGTLERLDVYVKSRAGGLAYDERLGTLRVPAGTSLYGGYGPDWIRDVAVKTAVLGAARAIRMDALPEDAWISGFAIAGGDSFTAAEDASALWAFPASAGPGTLFVEDNRFEAGDVYVANDATAAIPGSSYGVVVRNVAAVELRRNVIIAGSGGNGAVGANGTMATGVGNVGGDGGSAGTGWSISLGCGDGGNGAAGCSSTDASGVCVSTDLGGGGGIGNTSCGGGGTNGLAPTLLVSPDGADGPGGSGAGCGDLWTTPPPAFCPGVGHDGVDGDWGYAGGGGGGGGAGYEFLNPLAGGQGGHGGDGGPGGLGGSGGGGGGASIGLWLDVPASVDPPSANVTLVDNAVTTAAGGLGAGGGEGGIGLGGDAGGDPSAPEAGGGPGGVGGAGGTGGDGGRGGAGAGGPSFGIVLAPGTSANISLGSVAAGWGGTGGSNPEGSVSGSGGEGGYSYALYDLDLLDGANVVVNATALSYSYDAVREGSGAGGSPGGLVGAAGLKNW